MKVADFFCGAGGFSEGFRQAGFDVCFAVDKWLPAVNTYKANKPKCKVIQDDVIRISKLPDSEFHSLIPDTEVIIGSPPCVAFSNSNKSGNGDKTLGIALLKAYLRIIARKKFKEDSVLRYWILENVPNIKKFLQSEYAASDLELESNFTLKVINDTSSIYNAKYFGAPTNRTRFLCGEFPEIKEICDDDSVKSLKSVLESLGYPLDQNKKSIQDCNYPDFFLPRDEVSDHQYVYRLAPFEWKIAKRLKEDKGYMGKMSFPENLENPSRTVMANMSACSRESMILRTNDGGYRLPTVREAASMMSFPIDYKFYGQSKGIKHTLVGNAVPPKLAYAIAKAIASAVNESMPQGYIPIQHDADIPFVDLNNAKFEQKVERPKRDVSKFKYHIPYMIIKAYRVELTNYHSDFEKKMFQWTAEIHYSQGKVQAKKYQPSGFSSLWDKELQERIELFIASQKGHLCKSFDEFQKVYCMTSASRSTQQCYGPYELLESVKLFIKDNVNEEESGQLIQVTKEFPRFPKAILLGYYVINQMLDLMGQYQERKKKWL